MKILITGSSGLIGGEAVEYFDDRGHTVLGLDNNMRRVFFGAQGDNLWNLNRIYHKAKNFTHMGVDIRDLDSLKDAFETHGPFDAIIHCAAQPSHDKAKDIPIIDFEVNALGTLNLLEMLRQHSPEAVFIFMSTNKVYGDAPNDIPMDELDTRYDYVRRHIDDIDEYMRVDHSTHSIFGASKLSADVMTQEYGRYFGLRTCVLRCGCLTGQHHSGVQLHGFLSYLVKCAITGTKYTVLGYKGKQVRDNIHSYDVITAIETIIANPRPGSVYNMGGGRENSVSMIEAIKRIEELLDKKMNWDYIDQNRIGDHICYITNLTKFRLDYPDWKITKPIDRIFTELIGGSQKNIVTERYMPGDDQDEYFESYAKELVKLCKGKVIDIGCGFGYLTNRIANSEDVIHVTGTDKVTIRAEAHPKIFYWKINTEQLITSETQMFDTILSTEHIEHLNQSAQEKLLVWIKEKLNPDGIFIGSMPTPDDPKNPDKFHFKTYTMDKWMAVLDENFTEARVWKTHERGYCWEATHPKP